MNTKRKRTGAELMAEAKKKTIADIVKMGTMTANEAEKWYNEQEKEDKLRRQKSNIEASIIHAKAVIKRQAEAEAERLYQAGYYKDASGTIKKMVK
jgi:hypothetical protein